MKLKDAQIITNKELTDVTPEIVAELFAEMYSDEQARFFNHVAKVSSQWDGGGLVMQLQYLTDEDGLSLKGRNVMSYIGDYSHWGMSYPPLLMKGESDEP